MRIFLARKISSYRCVNPAGYNAFVTQFERVLPASSVANLYPFNYSGKTDRRGFYIGKDRYGTNVLVDFDQRDDDKTSANIRILGNSGQGKSYLMKLLTLNLLEAGKTVISLDVEHEQVEMCEAVGGCFINLMSGKYINVLEPKSWGETDGDTDDASEPETFRKSKEHIEQIPVAFSLLDTAISEVNRNMDDGLSLDLIQVKAVFLALCFGDPEPTRRAADRFVDCFYSSQETTRTVEREDGAGNIITETEIYTRTAPVSLAAAYANLQTLLGREITDEDMANIVHIYSHKERGGSGGARHQRV